MELYNSLSLFYTGHLWWSTFLNHWIWHLRRSKASEYMSLRRHTTQFPICPIKSLMLHREDFLSPNEHISGVYVPSEGEMCLNCPKWPQWSPAVFIISDEEKIWQALVVSRFQPLDALESKRKLPQNKVQNLVHSNCRKIFLLYATLFLQIFYSANLRYLKFSYALINLRGKKVGVLIRKFQNFVIVSVTVSSFFLKLSQSWAHNFV